MRSFLFAVVPLALLLAPATAHATADFPAAIVTDLNITCANPIFDGNGCTICHTTNNGGLGTATHPFGVYMKSHGLAAFNETELKTLLQQLDAESPHSTGADCFGTPYIDLLENCQWQTMASATCTSGGDAGPIEGVAPSVYYGCSAAPSAPRLRRDGPNDPAMPASFAIAFAGLLGFSIFRASSRRRSADRARRSSPQ
ncbi:MAG TPA: hypothetical protein VGH87_18935 [Polyangiaceae bacterium]|jgi:hypothetical protein|nr:hypothetical protein [Polyangiaceae bacterium]